MPVGVYLGGVVIIFAFPRSKSGIFDLIFEKTSHSQTASYQSLNNANAKTCSSATEMNRKSFA